ncbi:MAG: ribonuclease P protein component [Deltaproteobacteria bacterium]|nr:MAG: ribonuclease P protein component [Deltaproteobacteria bacterium]
MAAECGAARFRRSDRLLRSRDFQWVTRHGRRVASRYFVVIAARSRGRDAVAGDRLGITVSRKVGNAVVRNRVKRRIREWFRARDAARARGLDVVVIARRAAVELDGNGVRQELARLFEDDAGRGAR